MGSKEDWDGRGEDGVESELAGLRKRLEQVEDWKTRREEIEEELRKVMVEGGEEIAPPPYFLDGEAERCRGSNEGLDDVENASR